MAFESVNPFNQEKIEEFSAFSNNQIEKAILLSEETFQHWRKTTFSIRSEKLRSIASILRENKEVYGRTITLEMGKPITESLAEIEKCAWVCEYYAEHGEKFLANKSIGTDASQSYVAYEPIGSVLAIMPWNFPFWQVFRFAAPAIMAGNTALLKHASNVCRSALHIEDIIKEGGCPEGVFQTLLVESARIDQIIDHRVVKAVTLTGSEGAGSHVAARAGKNIKKTVLELGGSNAFVVLEDADLDHAIQVGIKARFQNTGQSCIAAKRFIIQDTIYDEFKKKFESAMKELVVGDPLQQDTTIGPLARKDLAEELDDQVQRSIKKGAKLIYGGELDKAHYSPALLEKVSPGMPAFDEELFGPVAPFTKFSDPDQVSGLVNNTDFGLGASIFTNDIEKAVKIASEIEDGAVFINELVKSDPRLPFGGTKRSGYGRELSENGIKEFVNVKTMFINRQPFKQ